MNPPADQSIWAEARIAYLAGATAPEVCTRFGLGRSAFFARASSEGWRRTDMRPRRLDDLDDEEPIGHPRAAIDLVDDAMARATRAIDRGRLREARGWTKLAAELRQLAMQDADRTTWSATIDAYIEGVGPGVAPRSLEPARLVERPDGRPAASKAITHCSDRGICEDPDSVDDFENVEMTPAASPSVTSSTARERRAEPSGHGPAAGRKARLRSKLEMARQISRLAPDPVPGG
jgi:hypothetical protein